MVFAVLVRISLSGLHKSGASRLLVASFIALLAADIVYAVGILNGTYAFGRTNRRIVDDVLPV